MMKLFLVALVAVLRAQGTVGATGSGSWDASGSGSWAAETTTAPTAAPTTVAPTAAPTSNAPTAAPTTVAPTAAPTSNAPTSAAASSGAPTVAASSSPTLATQAAVASKVVIQSKVPIDPAKYAAATLAEARKKDPKAVVRVTSYKQTSTLKTKMAAVDCDNWLGVSLTAQGMKEAYQRSCAASLGLTLAQVTVSVATCGGTSGRRLSTTLGRALRAVGAMEIDNTIVSSTDKSASLGATFGDSIKAGFAAAVKALPAKFASVKLKIEANPPQPVAQAVTYETVIVTEIVMDKTKAAAMTATMAASTLDILKATGLKATEVLSAKTSNNAATSAPTAAVTAAPVVEESSSAGLIIGIIVGVLVVGGVVAYVLVTKSRAKVEAKQRDGEP